MYDLKLEAPTTRHLLQNSTVPMKTLGMEFSDLDPSPALDLVKTWVSTVSTGGVIKSPGSPSSGLGILLIGEPGHGKTTMASVALQALIKGMAFPTPRPGIFMDYPKFLRLEKESWVNEDAKKDIQAIYGDDLKSYVPLFVLDDLGKEYRTQSGWSENIFDALLRARFNAGLPTIVTTNVPMNKWRVTYGEPMESFAHEAFVSVVVESEMGDRRK